MKRRYDVVVIGSGFGGAIPAYRLAEAGRSVALLEQGARWGANEFPRTLGRVSGAFWANRRGRGFLEYRTFRRMDVIQGVGVGGGSLHYFNVHLRAPQAIFQRYRWPGEIDRGVLDPYYDRVQEKLESRQLTAPIGRSMPPRTEAFLAAAKRAGRTAQLVDIAVHTGAPRRNQNGVEQSPCVYCGNCMLGCHTGAKHTLDITYIAESERRFGLEVYPGHKADCITPLSQGGYRVSILDGVGQDGPTAVEAASVIVAAGALGSTELLLRCRDVHRTLPNLGPALGTRFSGNGDFLFAGAAGVPDLVDPSFGPSITAKADCSTDEHLITIEDLGFPDPMMWFVEGALPPRGGRFLRILQLVRDYLARAVGLGRASRLSEEISALLEGGRTARFLPYLGMGTDASDGQLRLVDGSIDLVWSHRASRRLFQQMEDALRELAKATGGSYETSFLWRWPLRKLLTAHPLGGCPMGTTPDTGLVDHRGQVWDYPGLFVTDGAAIPSALSVNPSLTIAALAERAAEWMLDGGSARGGLR